MQSTINQEITPPISENGKTQITKKKQRNSNLELYRIIVMLLIVAHHYVVNSGLFDLLRENAGSPSSSVMLLFGAWGKTGINCFVLITGYFMCTSKFTWQKLIKLYLQILFYALIIYCIFCYTGYETFSLSALMLKFFPIKSIADGFTSCFILFFLFTPFLNIFIRHMGKRKHALLCILLLIVYVILPSLPAIRLNFNYVEWFIALYIFASYIRLYSYEWKISHRQWGFITLMMFGIGCISILGLEFIYSNGFINSFIPYFFVADSNKIFAFLISVSSFMWFKDLNLKHNKIINFIGASTFGVLLIHANSDAMRQWLWKETVDCAGHFLPSVLFSLGYAIISIIIIFGICSFIEILRTQFIEPHILSSIYSQLHKHKFYRKFKLYNLFL